MMKRFLLLLTAAALLLSLSACNGANEKIRIGTGGAGGSYSLLGEAMKNILQEGMPDSTFAIKQTAGSAANFRLMEKGFLEMGIVQSNLLYNAQYGLNTYASIGAVPGIGAAAVLYPEALQIIVSADSGIRQIADLAGCRISICEQGSGTEYDVKKLLKAFAIPESCVELVNLDYEESAKALQSGTIDAFAVTAAVPFAVFTEIAKQMPVRLLGIPEKTQELILRTMDEYDEITIPANTYAGQTEDVRTIGVTAILAASEKVSAEKVTQMLQLLDDAGLVMELTDCDVFVRFHPGAAAYFGDDRLTAVQKNTNRKQPFVFGSQDG